jgi:hypothetical protein
MRPPPAATAKPKGPSWLELGSSAVDAGDLATAERCFGEAVKADEKNPRCHFYLAIVLEARENFAAAAEHLTRALRLDPNDADAARRLSSLVSRCTLPANVALDPAGLQAALHHDSSSSWIIANLALQYLLRGPLASVYELARREGWAQAARVLCVARSGEALKNELLLAVLRSNIVRDADIEQLLTAARRALLLEVAPERFLDRDLVTFAIAMLHQCRMNEYIWSVADAEEARLAQLQSGLSVPNLLAGDVHEGCLLLQCCSTRACPPHSANAQPRRSPRSGPKPCGKRSSRRRSRRTICKPERKPPSSLPPSPMRYRARWPSSTSTTPIRAGPAYANRRKGRSASCSAISSRPISWPSWTGPTTS